MTDQLIVRIHLCFQMSIANKNYLGAALAGLAIILFWLLGMPAWDRMTLLRSAIAERENILSSRAEILKKVEDLNNQYRERSSDVKRISSIVPNAKGAAELVSMVEAVSRQTGLQLIELTMGGSDIQDNKEMRTVFLELGLIGNYPSLTTFLGLLESNLRLIDVFEITVSRMESSGAQIVLNFRVKLNAYYLNIK